MAKSFILKRYAEDILMEGALLKHAAIVLLIPWILLADAGYLGSVIQGPVPLGDTTAVELLCQDVLIEAGRSRYRITGDFLFASKEREERVYMYFPVDVMTPFISALYSAIEPAQFIDRVEVSVNGEPEEVFPLFVVDWDPQTLSPLEWEEARELMRPLNPEEPEAGQPAYLTRMPSYAEITGSSSPMDSMYPAFHVQAMHAAWIVEADAEDTLLVEYRVTGDMTMDYEATMAVLCYPLQTGSTWAGRIGRGRVTAVPLDTAGFERITFAAGVLLPEPTVETPLELEPLEEIAAHPAFESSKLAGISRREYQGGFVWSFSNFEPRVAPTGWRALHPGLGDMYAMVSDSVLRWMQGESDTRPLGWAGSYVYLYLAAEPPRGLLVISVDGLPLRAEPSSDATLLAMLPVTTPLRVSRWNGDWALVDASVPEHLSETAGEYSGWVNLMRTDGEGLVVPTALPML